MARKWTRAERIALVAVLLAIPATIGGVLVVPEVRAALGLDRRDNDPAELEKKEPTASGPTAEAEEKSNVAEDEGTSQDEGSSDSTPDDEAAPDGEDLQDPVEESPELFILGGVHCSYGRTHSDGSPVLVCRIEVRNVSDGMLEGNWNNEIGAFTGNSMTLEMVASTPAIASILIPPGSSKTLTGYLSIPGRLLDQLDYVECEVAFGQRGEEPIERTLHASNVPVAQPDPSEYLGVDLEDFSSGNRSVFELDLASAERARAGSASRYSDGVLRIEHTDATWFHLAEASRLSLKNDFLVDLHIRLRKGSGSLDLRIDGRGDPHPVIIFGLHLPATGSQGVAGLSIRESELDGMYRTGTRDFVEGEVLLGAVGTDFGDQTRLSIQRQGDSWGIYLNGRRLRAIDRRAFDVGGFDLSVAGRAVWELSSLEIFEPR